MKTALASLAAILVLSGSAAGSTFFPAKGTGPTPDVAFLLDKARVSGNSTVYIDDMVFHVDTLAKSGLTSALWPSGIVYYVFDESLDQAKRSQWLTASRYWMDAADLSFVERVNEEHYIIIEQGDYNTSSTGMQDIPQTMKINNWDVYKIAHEIGHALGQIHEHQRDDRTPFILVHDSNISQTACDDAPCNSQFATRAADTYGNYDFESIMHYPQCAWSRCGDLACLSSTDDCRTIEVLPPYAETFQSTIGQTSYLSALDLAGMAGRYGPVPAGAIRAHGWNAYGQCNLRVPNSGFTKVAAGADHGLGLRADGSISAWGNNNYGQCNVPGPNGEFMAVAAGNEHSLGLKTNRSIVAWGRNDYSQLNVPAPNTGFVEMAAGYHHTLGLTDEGAIIAWGDDTYGQCSVPQPNSGFRAVAAGGYYSAGLKMDGSIVAWGRNDYGQCNVPSPNAAFKAVEAGSIHCLGLKIDGSVVAWGSGGYGECDVPAPNLNFTAIAAGGHHSLGLKADGSVVAWGSNQYGQAEAPLVNTGFAAIAAGSVHSLFLKGPVSTSVGDIAATSSRLGPIQPNPFNPLTAIDYSVARPGRVRLEVFDLRGRRVRDLVDQWLEPGQYTVQWNGTDVRGLRVASGVYFCRMETGAFRETKRMVLLR